MAKQWQDAKVSKVTRNHNKSEEVRRTKDRGANFDTSEADDVSGASDASDSDASDAGAGAALIRESLRLPVASHGVPWGPMGSHGFPVPGVPGILRIALQRFRVVIRQT